MTEKLLTEMNYEEDELVLEGLTPEDLIERGRKFRELLLTNMTPQEHLARIPVDLILRLVQQDEHLRRQIIARTPPKERLFGISIIEQRLASMTTEELITRLDLIERQLRQNNPKE